MRRVLAALVVCVGLVVAPSAPASAETPWQPGEATYDVVTTTDIPVTMPDGRVLRASIHAPAIKGTTTPAEGPFPVILVQTPYGKSVGDIGLGTVDDGLVERGYLGVIVDVAGTGGSEGQSQLFGKQEAEDGAELVRWAAELPNSTGKVGLVGGSYLGIDQMFTAAEVGPNSPLKAIFPIATASDPYRDLFVAGGIVNMESSLGLIAGYFGLRTLTPAIERGPKDPLDALRLGIQHGLAGIPFELTTGLDVLFQRGRTYDSAYWQERAPQRVLQKVVDNDVPVYLVGGQYDVFQRGEPLLYSGLQNAAAGRSVWAPMAPAQAADPRFQLLTGPWDHGNQGEGADLLRRELAWFDHWLKGVDTGVLDTSTPLHVIEPGGGSYDIARYPSEQASYERYYLRAGKKLGTEAPTEGTGSDSIIWKPLSLYCQRSLNQWGAGIFREVYETCKKYPPLSSPQPGDVAYDTGPLDSDLRLAGPIGLTLRATSNRPETMFVTTLQDVAPNGEVTDITAGALLGSARAIDGEKSWPSTGDAYALPYHPHTKAAEQRVPARKVTRYDIEIRPAFQTVEKGHSLRLLISSGDTPHLLPPPMKLPALLGGVYALQRNAVAASFIDLPVVN
ncbi:MAG: CocE/NonD family hydrolase [Aeromicrobium sp.]